MGDIEIDIEMSGHGGIVPALADGLDSGVKKSGDWMLREGERKAKDAVLSADRVWRGALKRGFQTQEMKDSSPYVGEIRNFAPHAGINERGLKPGSSPPVQKLIRWVDDNVVPNVTGDSSDWDPDLQALADRYSPGMVITTFAIKSELEKNGYPGIGYMEAAEAYLKQVGPLVVRAKVEKEMRRELRRKGVSKSGSIFKTV